METRGIILCVFICVFIGFSKGLGYSAYGLASPLATWKTYKTCYSTPSYPYYYGGGGLGCLRPGTACLKAKLLKNYLAMKKPLCAAKTCYPYGGCGLGGLGGCYPACGPCPYASYLPKCLKHKASLALCH